ncbi:MAG: hypothetical protein P4L87_05640 [Formivibrio sp.]|nr:hypothetical protein [Formivibrio sp.]
MKKYVTLVIAMFSTAVFAFDGKYINHITKDEFNKMNSYFVKSGCNIEGFINSANDLDVSSTYHDDEGKKHPKQIANLDKDSLCLLSRSYYVVVTYEIEKNGKKIEKLSDKYPEIPSAIVTEIQFRIPPKMAKECDDDAIAAFFITFTKNNGKLQRDVLLVNDLLSCNEGMLDVPKDYKYKKGNN